MPAGEGQERERFAAAVEQGFDAVPPGDEELLRELELVALLKQSRASLAPSADASARMRARVMAAAAEMLPATAVTPSSDETADDFENAATLVDTPVITEPIVEPVAPVAEAATAADGTEAADTSRTNVVPIGRAKGRHRFPRTVSRPSRRGQLTVTAAAALMVIAATGGGALFSQGALPGDSLYGVKQTTESALVGLTPGQGNKAQRQLDYAATRIDEVDKLNTNATAPGGDRGADISQALRGFNDQTAAGSRMWLSSAGNGNAAELGALSNWAQTQSQRLSAMRSTMPASAQPDADHSLRMLEDLRTRAQSLSNRQGCDKITSGEEDQLGPTPSKGACSSRDNTIAPTTKPVAPSLPARSGRSSDSPSSEQEPSSGSSSDRGESKPAKPATPELPGLGGLTGGNNRDGVAPLPERVPTSEEKPLPEKPGLNLQLPLLPIMFQPMPNGSPKPLNG